VLPEAVDEREAIAKSAEEFKAPAAKLIATRAAVGGPLGAYRACVYRSSSATDTMSR